MDIQVLNQAEVERQKERKKEAKELEGLPKRAEGTSDDPVRMYLKEMGSVPLLTREEEVEISKRIEKAQIQIERIIMRFRYSTGKQSPLPIILISAKSDSTRSSRKKRSPIRRIISALLPKVVHLLKEEDDFWKRLLEQIVRSRS